MAATTNAEVHVAAGRRLHGGRPLHGGEELHGGRAALNDGSVESSAVRWMAPCLLGGDEAVGVGAFSRRRSSQLHRVAGGRRFHGRRQDHGPCENGRGRGGPAAEGGGDPFRCPSATRAYLGLARTYVPRNRASIVFDRYQTEGDGGRRTARHQTEGDGGRWRLKGGGGGSTPAAVARGKRWRTEGGGDPREAAIRGRRWRPEMLSSPPAEDAGQMRSPSRVEETVTERKETERS